MGDRSLLLSVDERTALWAEVGRAVESYIEDVESLRVAPELSATQVRALVDRVSFEHPMTPLEAVEFVASGLREHQVHTPHPRYFGLFNPAVTAMGIGADTLAAAFNPQIAAWSHNPFAAEVEMRLVRELGSKFGYESGVVDGTFCSGGAEANHTALLCALHKAFPDAWQEGLGGTGVRPVLYVSSEAHHSFQKAARLSGIGARGVRSIPANRALKMDTLALRSQIESDSAAGFTPFLLVGTAGTTSAGVVDPLPELEDIANAAGMWLHVDAAWGGAAALVPELRGTLEGMERADSITFDAHKWLSVPMGAGVFLTRHKHALQSAFATAQNYMPRDAEGLGIVDPFNRSMQWSRRFIGLKVFMSLAVAGWDGYADAIRHQTAMGDLLREELTVNGWDLVNDTPLPTVCFVDGRSPRGRDADYLRAICAAVVSSGQAWISTTLLAGTVHALRACITNYRTNKEDIRALIAVLGQAREDRL